MFDTDTPNSDHLFCKITNNVQWLKINQLKMVFICFEGHTHGGQFFPTNIIGYLTNPYYSGIYQPREGTYVYVSPGTWYNGPPMRLFSRAEITLITLLSTWWRCGFFPAYTLKACGIQACVFSGFFVILCLNLYFIFCGMWRACKSSKIIHPGSSGGLCPLDQRETQPVTNFSGFFTFVKSHIEIDLIIWFVSLWAPSLLFRKGLVIMR